MLACSDKAWHIHSTDFAFCWGMASARYPWLQAPMNRTSYLSKVLQYAMSIVKNCACLDTTFYVCSNKADNNVKQKQYFILLFCVIV